MVQMSTVEKEPVKPFGFRPEFIAEEASVDGGSLYRFTFAPDGGDDLSEDFYRFVTTHMSCMDYDHITIHCPNGHPAWLTSFFRKLDAYGFRVEVTPAPTDPDLIAAIERAAAHTPFRWPAAPVATAATALKEPASTPNAAPAATGTRRHVGRLATIGYCLTAVAVGLILFLVKKPIQSQFDRGTVAGYATAFVIGIVAIMLAIQARVLVRVILNRKR
jgi:hypothetical protein